jgi:hypothetical protein
LTGELEYAKFNKDSILSTQMSSFSSRSVASKQELELREQVAKEEKKSLSKKN